MALPFSPPQAPSSSQLSPYTPPPTTNTPNLSWASLRTIPLSDLDSTSKPVLQSLVTTTKKAITEDGFLFLTEYGVSLEQLHRQFAIAKFLHENITEHDKERLLWDPDSGKFRGWKRRWGWKREIGKYDGIEQFNFYDGEFADENGVPACMNAFMPEVRAFCDYLTHSVNRRLLRLLSMVLELPEDYLWDHVQSHNGVVGEGYFRHALFYPLEGDQSTEISRERMRGHTDHGTTTFLFSVPITALQILQDDEWRFVPYKPGALVINLGEVLEVLSGGHLKATLHKVSEPPEDQRHQERLSLVLFNASKGDMRLEPLVDSPLIQREGFVEKQGVFTEFKKLQDAGLPVPTCKEWREIQISKVYRREERLEDTKEIDGRSYRDDEFLGVQVVTPV